MENLQNNKNTNLENQEIKKNMGDEFLSFLKENGKISQIPGEMNTYFSELKFAIEEKNFEEIEEAAKGLEAHIFWATMFITYVRFKSVLIELDKQTDMTEENKKLMIKFSTPTRDIKSDTEAVKKFIGFYSAPDYRWEDGKVKAARGEDSASYQLMKELLDYLKIEIVSVNE